MAKYPDLHKIMQSYCQKYPSKGKGKGRGKKSVPVSVATQLDNTQDTTSLNLLPPEPSTSNLRRSTCNRKKTQDSIYQYYH